MKNFKKACIISGIINALCLVINLVSFIIFKKIPLALSVSGGDWDGRFGFGIKLSRIAAMTLGPSEGGGSHTSIAFEPFSLALTLVLIFAVSFIVLVIKDKKAQNKEHTDND